MTDHSLPGAPGRALQLDATDANHRGKAAVSHHPNEVTSRAHGLLPRSARSAGGLVLAALGGRYELSRRSFHRGDLARELLERRRASARARQLLDRVVKRCERALQRSGLGRESRLDCGNRHLSGSVNVLDARNDRAQATLVLQLRGSVLEVIDVRAVRRLAAACRCRAAAAACRCRAAAACRCRAAAASAPRKQRCGHESEYEHRRKALRVNANARRSISHERQANARPSKAASPNQGDAVAVRPGEPAPKLLAVSSQLWGFRRHSVAL